MEVLTNYYTIIIVENRESHQVRKITMLQKEEFSGLKKHIFFLFVNFKSRLMSNDREIRAKFHDDLTPLKLDL